MPTTLLIRFPWGRYHATPWGHHVNEGAVELPPSPWRLLRALYAVWQTRAPDLPEATVHSLLGRLAEPPAYLVPSFHLAHTRHYYPDSHHRGDNISVDRTLDAFAVFARGAELAVCWPFTLPAEEYKAFDRLASSLPYLGRADSICEAELVDETPNPAGRHCLNVTETAPADQDTVTVLAPTLPLDLAALVQRPVDIRAGKLLFPRSTKWVAYPRPAETRSTTRPRRRQPAAPSTVLRYTITSRVLPPYGDTVIYTDRLRRAALSRCTGNRTLLAGKEHDDSPLRGQLQHQHAHYLGLPDHDGKLAELAIWIPAGLTDDDLDALSRVQQLYAHERAPGMARLSLRMASYGPAAQVLPELVGPARQWTSLTPFIPGGHVKHTLTDHIRRRICKELAYRDLPPPGDVQVLTDGPHWRSFTRRRPSHAAASRTRTEVAQRRPPPCRLQLTFGQPVNNHAPLALGQLSHFGLGLFLPG